MSVYLIDSSVFIEAHRSYYPFDVFVGFWNSIKILANQNRIISLDKVKNEIYHNEDELKKWCENNLPKDFFKSSADSIAKYQEIAKWSKSNEHYREQAKTKFLDSDYADAFLIAYALTDADSIILATQEVGDPLSKRSIKIPDVCNEFNIQYCNTVEMLRSLSVMI